MKKVKVFISFDYEHDIDVKSSLVAQSKNEESPFEIIDMSIKEAIDFYKYDYMLFDFPQDSLIDKLLSYGLKIVPINKP